MSNNKTTFALQPSEELQMARDYCKQKGWYDPTYVAIYPDEPNNPKAFLVWATGQHDKVTEFFREKLSGCVWARRHPQKLRKALESYNNMVICSKPMGFVIPFATVNDINILDKIKKVNQEQAAKQQ